MSNMMFMPKLVDFLRRNGYIYTVRKYNYRSGDGGVGVDDIICRRTLVKQIFQTSELQEYVIGSGFDTLVAWCKQIREFTGVKAIGLYLYKIEVVK